MRINKNAALHHCEKNWRWKPRPLTDYDFWIVFRGRGRLEIDGVGHAVRRGFGVLLAPGQRPVGSHDPEDPLVVFSMHFDLFEPRGRKLDATRLLLPPRRLEHPAAVERCCRELVRKAGADDALAREESSHLFWLVFLALVPREGASDGVLSDERLQRVRERVTEAPGSLRSVGEMARLAHLSTPQFTRLWRRGTGESPKQFLIRERIRRARMLLEESNMSVSEVAEALGYGDVYFFSRQFRQQTGEAPSALRRR